MTHRKPDFPQYGRDQDPTATPLTFVISGDSAVNKVSKPTILKESEPPMESRPTAEITRTQRFVRAGVGSALAAIVAVGSANGGKKSAPMWPVPLRAKNGSDGSGGNPSSIPPSAGNGGEDETAGTAGMPDSDAGASGTTDTVDTTESDTTNQYDPCGLNFVAGETPDGVAQPGDELGCKFIGPDKYGYEVIEGELLSDPETGFVQPCFISPSWSLNTALKIIGKIERDVNTSGIITMVKGKLCVTMLDSEAGTIPKAEIKIPAKVAEAPLAAITEGSAMFKIEESTDGSKTLLVTSGEGRTLVTQEGRTRQIIVEEGETVRIPLNIERNPMSCSVAHVGEKSDSKENEDGTLIIGAGAAFLMLRRRKTRKKS
jgi:hypothetical protein